MQIEFIHLLLAKDTVLVQPSVVEVANETDLRKWCNQRSDEGKIILRRDQCTSMTWKFATGVTRGGNH